LSKFLSIITFGLLGGKSKSANPSPRPQSSPPVRFEGDGGRPQRDGNRPPRDRGDRENRPPREARAPREPRREEENTEVTTERLYVGNLSYDASESDLFELFSGVGKVQNCEVVVNSRTQRSKGFAFITMGSVDEAKRAVAELRGKDFMGRAVQVSGAKPPSRDREDRGEHNEAPAEQEESAAA
jgi:RNA recognition motif-containing protein